MKRSRLRRVRVRKYPAPQGENKSIMKNAISLCPTKNSQLKMTKWTVSETGKTAMISMAISPTTTTPG